MISCIIEGAGFTTIKLSKFKYCFLVVVYTLLESIKFSVNDGLL